MADTKKEQYIIPNVKYGFYKFIKQYMRIKDIKGNKQKFSKKQLNKIKEMEKMMNNGYELKLIHSRRNTKLCWFKK